MEYSLSYDHKLEKLTNKNDIRNSDKESFEDCNYSLKLNGSGSIKRGIMQIKTIK